MGSIWDNAYFVTFISILFAGLGLLIAYAIYSRFVPQKDAGLRRPSPEQCLYMRGVTRKVSGGHGAEKQARKRVVSKEPSLTILEH